MTPPRSLLFAAAAIAPAFSAHGQVLYSSDFEADDGGLIVTAGTDWEHGVPTSGPGVAHSGTQCWGTSLAGVPSTDLQGLALPVIDASVATGDDVELGAAH